MSSSVGQRALQSVVSIGDNPLSCIEDYDIPERLIVHDHAALLADECGWPVLKVAKNGALQSRRIGFSVDRRQLLVTSKKIHVMPNLLSRSKNKHSRGHSRAGVSILFLHSMDRIDRGAHHSHRFLRLESSADPDTRRYNAQYAQQCFTIHYYSAAASVSHSGSLESLDVVIPDKRHFQVLWNALEDLLFLAHSELCTYIPTSQWLHFQWTHLLHKSWETPLTHSEWMILTAEQHYGQRKKSFLSAVFQQASDEDECLLFDETCLLLEQLRPNQDPIVNLWHQLLTTDPVPQPDSVSAVALLSFVRSQQKRFAASLEQVTELIHVLNQQMAPEDELSSTKSTTRLGKSRFLAWMASDTNDLMDPSRGTVNPDDMDQALSHYWIHTAHDTYRSGDNSSDVLQYTLALHRGVRCLELDITASSTTDDDPQAADPMVGTTIPLPHVCRAIRSFLNQFPQSYPILLKLEYSTALPTTTLQLKVANVLYEYFGAAHLLLTLPEQQSALPTPASARGKVMVMGKRPRTITAGATVLHDDTDALLLQHDKNNHHHTDDHNKPYKQTTTARTLPLHEDSDDNVIQEEDEDDSVESVSRGAVMGFTASGPVRHPHAISFLAPDTLLAAASEEAHRTHVEKEEMDTLQRELWKQVDAHEELTASLTQQAGLSPAELKIRAARARDEGKKEEHNDDEEQGFEVHEVLNSAVVESQDAYAVAAQDSIQAAQRTSQCSLLYRDAEQLLRQAEQKVAASKEMERTIQIQSQRANQEARMHQEHATCARERVDRVRGLLKNSQHNASSAGSVVQTALTEAKISEQRAVEAEARAEKAKAGAQQDRARAELETQREELLEQEVNDLQTSIRNEEDLVLQKAGQMEKSHAMLERNNEQIKLIESSSQYRKERLESAETPEAMLHTSSFFAKHEAKLEERIALRDVVWKASQDKLAAESRVTLLRNKLDDRARSWRAQANVASQARRTADRSAAFASDLVENAEEEREAAELRLTACEKAVATVENRGSQRMSVEAQLAEAERAAVEAADQALQSRNRAQALEKEAVETKDHTSAVDEVVRRQWELKQAQRAFEVAQEEQTEKDSVTAIEKRRLDTNSSVYQTATRTAKSEGMRIHIVQVLQQEAIVAYNTSLMLRDQAEDAVSKAEAASAMAQEKRRALEHARRYKAKRDVTMEIPTNLAKSTFVHFSRFRSWKKSLSLSNAYAHTFTYSGLQKMVSRTPAAESANFRSFTESHLCRVIPPDATSNADPVYPWSMGIQLVSTNLHGADEETLLVTDGRFRQNGSCGYVLKPKCLLDTSGHRDLPQTWTFTILSGYNIPKASRRSCPYVRVSLFTGEDVVHSHTTEAGSNPANPVWKTHNKFTFSVNAPSLAIVSFAVYESNGGALLGGAAVPVHCIREGYRSVSLFGNDHSRTGPLCYASLFVKALKK